LRTEDLDDPQATAAERTAVSGLGGNGVLGTREGSLGFEFVGDGDAEQFAAALELLPVNVGQKPVVPDTAKGTGMFARPIRCSRRLSACKNRPGRVTVFGDEGRPQLADYPTASSQTAAPFPRPLRSLPQYGLNPFLLGASPLITMRTYPRHLEPQRLPSTRPTRPYVPKAPTAKSSVCASPEICTFCSHVPHCIN
jgi:hypothetical protein